MTGAAVRVGVGTRLRYDGEVVVVEEMFGSAAGNEVLVLAGPGRRFRLSLREVLASGRAQVIATGPRPESDDDRETASVLFALLSEEELAGIRPGCTGGRVHTCIGRGKPPWSPRFSAPARTLGT